MKHGHWLLTIFAAVACLWVLVMSLLPFFLDGHLYHIEQPVPVVAIGDDQATLRIARRSLVSMEGLCALELQCTMLYEFGEQSCMLEKGESSYTITVPLSPIASGTCAYRGTVQYSPLGWLGPRLLYLWVSEEFVVEGK